MKLNKRDEIVVSKIILGILAIYVLLSFFIFLALTREDILPIVISAFDFENKSILLHIFDFIYVIIFLAGAIFPIVVFGKILLGAESKYTFTNFERKFHPFFEHYEKNWLWSITVVVIFWGGQILLLTWKDGWHPFAYWETTNIFLYFLILLVIYDRKLELDKLPINLMKKRNLRLLFNYDDYTNGRISDDEPHLIEYQYFELSIKHLPRNMKERKLIEIRNNNTPNNSALIARIEDFGLAEAIRSGDVVKAQLVSIRYFAVLEIEISISTAKSHASNPIS